jgi:hypothetical protein
VAPTLRREFRTPYPLATAKPFVMGKELVFELQEKNDLPSAITTVVRSRQTVALTPEARRLLLKGQVRRPGFGERRVGSFRPVRRRRSSSIRWCAPDVPTSVVWRPSGCWELHDAGERVDEIAEGYDLTPELVRSAIAYEEQQRSLAA